MNWNIELNDDDFCILADYEKDVPVIDLISKIKYLLGKGFKSSENDDFTIRVYIENLCEDLKGEYLEKKIFDGKMMKNFDKNWDRLLFYNSKGAKLCLNSDDLLCFKLKLSGDFRIIDENNISINGMLIENLNFETASLELTKRNIDRIDFDNLNKIRIDEIHMVFSDEIKHIENIVNKYKGYCVLNGKNYANNSVLENLFYNSGSMIWHQCNVNGTWRKKLFILVSSNINYLQNNESMNSYDDIDLLANPIVILKIANYLNQK